jgi:hypothetical protein
MLLRAPVAPWIWFLASILTTVAGPFGTYDVMPFLGRLVFWPGLMALGMLSAYVLCAILSAFWPHLNVWLHDAIVAVVFSVLFTPLVSLVLNLTIDTPIHYSGLFVEVLAISGCVAVVQRLIKLNWPHLGHDAKPDVEARPHSQAQSPAPDLARAEAPPAPRLLRRLDGVRAPEILRLTVEDHYVEVVLLGRPSQRILMRFSDAVDEIEGLEGVFVHRSHWVVRAHILGAVAENGRDMVEMIDGSRVPVSRTYRSNLAAAGVLWLERDRVAG